MIFLQDSKTNFRSFWIQKPLCRCRFGTGWFRRVPQVDGKPKGLQVAIGIAIEKLFLPSVQATFKLFCRFNCFRVKVWRGEMAKAGVGGQDRMPEKRICAGAQRLASL